MLTIILLQILAELQNLGLLSFSSIDAIDVCEVIFNPVLWLLIVALSGLAYYLKKRRHKSKHGAQNSFLVTSTLTLVPGVRRLILQLERLGCTFSLISHGFNYYSFKMELCHMEFILGFHLQNHLCLTVILDHQKHTLFNAYYDVNTDIHTYARDVIEAFVTKFQPYLYSFLREKAREVAVRLLFTVEPRLNGLLLNKAITVIFLRYSNSIAIHAMVEVHRTKFLWIYLEDRDAKRFCKELKAALMEMMKNNLALNAQLQRCTSWLKWFRFN
jgi:hypothetical protein